MLYPECLTGLLLALALIRGKETVLIMSTDASLPDGFVTGEAGGLFGFNWWVWIDRLAGTHQNVTLIVEERASSGLVDTTHLCLWHGLSNWSIHYPLWALSERWKITRPQETASTQHFQNLGVWFKTLLDDWQQVHLWSCFKPRFTACVCRTVNHQLLGDEGQLKVPVNIKFMSRSLNWSLLLTQMGGDVWLMNFKFTDWQNHTYENSCWGSLANWPVASEQAWKLSYGY